MCMKNATKLCPKCQTEIPVKATTCPNCRSDLRSWWRKHPIFTWIIVIILIWIITQSLQENSPEYKEQQVQEQIKNNESQEIINKVEVISVKVYDRYNFEHLWVTIKNNVGKDIDWITVKASFKNNFGESIRESISNAQYFYGIGQDVIANGKTTDLDWQLSLFNNATTVDEFTITRLHFTDGTIAEIE